VYEPKFIVLVFGPKYYYELKKSDKKW